MHKIRLAGRRSTCFQEQPTATMSIASRIPRIHRIVSMKTFNPSGVKTNSPTETRNVKKSSSPMPIPEKPVQPDSVHSYSEGLQVVKKSEGFI